MDNASFALLRARLESMLQGRELADDQGEDLIALVRYRMRTPQGLALRCPLCQAAEGRPHVEGCRNRGGSYVTALGEPTWPGKAVEAPAAEPKRRGRPKGSKNKHKGRKAKEARHGKR